MGGLTFDEVMKFYPGHNFDTYRDILKAKKSGGLLPFMGAGLSVFCGYKLWGGVLWELVEYIYDTKQKQEVFDKIKAGAYGEAAQLLLEYYPPMLDRLPRLISPDKLEACPPEKRVFSAAYTLPLLFQTGLVITTNFDRVLEDLYLRRSKKPIEVVTPKQQDRLAQFRQNGAQCLFKLHGDIGKDAVALDDLVFTGEQYDDKYRDGGLLVQELTRCFENRRLLFLGCSLNADRTMEVLKHVCKAQPGIRHYAILGCKKGEVPKRLAELYRQGIEAIFYDDSNHDAVRVILERLLEDTDPAAYRQLRREAAAAAPVTREERRLLFDAEYFAFTGREAELEALRGFCDAPDCASWWAVTGPGGMGKSRLVYEFSKELREKGWQVERFEARPSKDSAASDLDNLETWAPGSGPTLAVLDDVQAHMELVLRRLSLLLRQPRSEKLRFLLLEREGEDRRSAPWLGPSGGEVPEDWLYQERFLCLKSLGGAELKQIMDDYAAAAGKKLNAELLLKTLERVDPKLKRPLYAIAIADARCQGKDPTNWDPKTVLDTLLARELAFHLNRFRGMTGKSATNTQEKELKTLLARSCIEAPLLLEEIDAEACPKLWKKLEDLDMDPEEFFGGLGVLRSVQLYRAEVDETGKITGEPTPERRQAVALSCPDLLKEYLVLDLVLEQIRQKAEPTLLFPEGWEQDPRRLLFLQSLLRDHRDRLKGNAVFWSKVLQAEPENPFAAILYGHLLSNYGAVYPDSRKAATERLARLYEAQNHDADIALFYASALVNLTAEQKDERCAKTVSRLEALYQKHADVPEIAVAYASGLCNLTVGQDEAGCAKTVSRLKALYQKHADVPEIAEAYANGLFNLTVVQDEAGRAKTVSRLEALYQKHADVPEIAVQYAKGLYNLTVVQDEAGCAKTVSRLEALYQKHADVPEIAVQYANGLYNLTVEQDEAGCTETVSRLEALYQKHTNVPEIAEAYANGLVCQAAAQNETDCAKTVSRLETLHQAHADAPEPAAKLAAGLVCLSAKQTQEARAGTEARLERLLETHAKQPAFAEAYAGALVNCALHQTKETEIHQTLFRSRQMLTLHPEDQEIQLDYAMTWFNLTLRQAEDAIPATLRELAAYLRQHAAAIPEFRKKLDSYLSRHPEQRERYQPLFEL